MWYKRPRTLQQKHRSALHAFMNTSSTSETLTSPITICDQFGKPIEVGSIVEVCGYNVLWGGTQGRVVSLTAPGSPGCVAVYFFREVKDHLFHWQTAAGHMPIHDWDLRYANQNWRDEIDFLLKDDLWKRSPRVQYIRAPEDLVVIPRFGFAHRAARVFPDHHSTYNFPEDMARKEPSDFICLVADCKNPAAHIALCNLWGSVFPLYTCPECYHKIHGLCVDDLPPMKKPYLYADGTPRAEQSS